MLVHGQVICLSFVALLVVSLIPANSLFLCPLSYQPSPSLGPAVWGHVSAAARGGLDSTWESGLEWLEENDIHIQRLLTLGYNTPMQNQGNTMFKV